MSTGVTESAGGLRCMVLPSLRLHHACGELEGPVGMAVSWGLLRGYGDRVGISIFSLLSLSTTK